MATHLVPTPPPAVANVNQQAMIEDDPNVDAAPQATLQKFRLLGATVVRVFLPWAKVAPNPLSTKRPRNFNASNPASYPAANWVTWDNIVQQAKTYGITVDLLVAGGSPRWVDGTGIPNEIKSNLNRAWKPKASEYGAFMRALGTRYSGHYVPKGQSTALPAVHFWSIWNEPNFGEDLGPQATNGSKTSFAPGMYRSLVNAGWSALQGTGHGRDTILIGGLAARGANGPVTRSHPQGLPGNFAQTKPLQFIRTLYCVNSSYQELRGSAASQVGCPTSAAASRKFRTSNPGLFQASGFGIHPYPQNQPPTKELSRDPDYVAFPEIPRLETDLDRLQRTYSSGTHFRIYNDEYGYITNPPNHGKFVNPLTAAYYINWAEYLSWKNPRIATTMQYLLYDPAVTAGADFASGLLFRPMDPKPSYNAYRLPLYLPLTSARRGESLEVWGDARPAPYEQRASGQAQVVQIQLQRGSTWTTVKSVPITSAHGYFDVRVPFPASGQVRLAWSYPTTDPLLPSDAIGATVYSRYQKITIH
ncbi:MAG: hypothetical protein WBP81_13785 [Solirubrobacteraceae bacterium]